MNDEQERAEVRRILGELPADHPAVKAFQEDADTIRLTYLVGRDDLVEKLKRAYLDGFGRLMRSSSSFRP